MAAYKTGGGGGDISVEKYLRRYNDMKTEKAPWNVHFQRLAETFLTRKQSFTSSISQGEFLYDDVFDNTGEHAAMQAASVFLSMLWPDSSRTFNINPVDELKGVPGVEEWFRFITRQTQRFMDKPQAGLLIALQEFQIDMQVFGTSGVGVFEGEDSDSLPVVYEAWGVKNMCISENAQGFVDMIYTADMRTVRQIVEEYGLENVHATVSKAFQEGKYEDKFEVLKVLEPRSLAERGNGKGGMLDGVKGMATRTLHIDVTHKKIMRESGYAEFPVAVGRAIKTIGEKYGRSPAMVALPDAGSLNALKEAIIVATEKQLDPPLYVLDDGRLGGGVIDTSAGALNVFNASGRLDMGKPIDALFTVGEMQSAEKLEEKFKEAISQAFGLDRLLDLNNQTQMTAYETSVRNRMRGESLGSMFSRQEAEVFTPLIERTFNILYRKGHFGVQATGFLAMARKLWAQILGKPITIIPPAVAAAIEAGLDVYEVEYISPAKRFMQSEKLQGIYEAAEFFAKMGAVPGFEEMADNLDMDDMADNVVKYSGAPISVLRTDSARDAIRKGRAEAQMAQAEMAAAQQMSETARNAGQAVQAFSGGGGGGAAGK
jgi:hypothetical protein